MSISPNEHSGLISFRIDWFGLLAVQGTLKSLPQHHSLKASILQRSVFFIVQLSHPYMTTGKTIALTATAKSLQSCPTLCNPRDGSPPGSPIPGFSRQEYWSGVSLPSPIASARRTFIGKVMSLLLNRLARFVIAFLPRSKYLFNLMATVTIRSDFGDQESKVCQVDQEKWEVSLLNV